MDEEFESLVVTDPDLVDEGIDISGLRTQTDVSPYLLGNIPVTPCKNSYTNINKLVIDNPYQKYFNRKY